jgi:hypothetical protein
VAKQLIFSNISAIFVHCLRFDTGLTSHCRNGAREAELNFYPKNADGTALGEPEPNLILLPIPESEYLKRCGNGKAHASGNEPTASTNLKPRNNAYEVARAPEAGRELHRLEHVVTGADVSTMPGDEASIPSPDSSKKHSLVGRKSIVVCAVLSLAIGIIIGVAWSTTNALTANSLRDAQKTIFSVPSKAEQTPQPSPVVATATDPAVTEIAQRMDAIARDLSLVQQNIKELAAGQEKIRKTQEQLAETQSHLAAVQAQANAKQNKRPVPDPTDGRKLNRHDSFYYRLR